MFFTSIGLYVVNIAERYLQQTRKKIIANAVHPFPVMKLKVARPQLKRLKTRLRTEERQNMNGCGLNRKNTVFTQSIVESGVIFVIAAITIKRN